MTETKCGRVWDKTKTNLEYYNTIYKDQNLKSLGADRWLDFVLITFKEVS